MKLNYIIFILSLTCNSLLFSGFTSETAVLTSDGFISISALEIDDAVISFNGTSTTLKSVTHTITHETFPLIALYFENSTMPLICAAEQKCYVPACHAWVIAQELRVGDQLLTAYGTTISITTIHLLKYTDTLYEITVDTNHTFFVSEHAVLMHNPVPIVIGISFAFGSGAIEFMGVSVSMCAFGVWIGAKIFGKNNKQEKSLGSIGDCNVGVDMGLALEPCGNTYSPISVQNTELYVPIQKISDEHIDMAKQKEKKKPQEKKQDQEKDNEKEKRNATNQPDAKKEERDKKIKEYRPLTDKEAKEKAKIFGCPQDKNAPKIIKDKVSSHGNSPIFKNSKKDTWITPDQDGHNGGVWKEFDRNGNRKTLDENLEPIGK